MFINCTINPPKVEMTGEKTSLENQILGTYREIESDVWMIASVRSTGAIGLKPENRFISDEKRKVIEAIQNRRFNKDDIDEYKALGVIGENNRGYLTFLDNTDIKLTEDYKKILYEIMNEENRDRKIIMERVISVDPKLSLEDMPEIEKVFANQNRQQAKKGEWIQLVDGKWIRKK